MRDTLVAREAGTRTRGRVVAEALPTMWPMGTLQPRGLIARVLLGLRKESSFNAPKVGLPSDGRAEGRVTRSHLSDGGVKSRLDRLTVSQLYPANPGNERSKELSQAYRRSLRQHEDTTYVNLGTIQNSPLRE